MTLRRFLVPKSRTLIRNFHLENTTISDTPTHDINNVLSKRKQKGHSIRLGKYFESNPHLKKMKDYIPAKHLQLKRKTKPESLYLIDDNIAKSIVQYILPVIESQKKDQIIGETNAGLGLISSELLDRGIPMVRLYESCSEFRNSLKDFTKLYKNRVEIFTKDIYQLQRIDYIDKQDRGTRVDQLLKGIPKREWTDDPVLTIMGPMAKCNFLTYILKMMALQSKIVLFGRIQLFAIMKPEDYITLSAGPTCNLHTYQRRSVLFNLMFDHKLLEKYPRKAFLPWEVDGPKSARTRYAQKYDLENMYLVHLVLKKELPVPKDQLISLYYFVFQFFGKGTNPVIPTLEKWIPGCGANLISVTNNNFPELDIYSRFGELSPQEILEVFQVISSLPNYANSPFASMIESDLLKTETVETTSASDAIINPEIVTDIHKHLDDV